MRNQFRRALLAAPVAGLLAVGVMAAPANAAGKASVRAFTTTEARTCTVVGSMSWKNETGIGYVTLQIYDATTDTAVGLGSNFSTTQTSGTNSTPESGVSGDQYYSVGSVYTSERGDLLGSSTSRTITLSCR